jgi:transposase
LPLDYKLKSGIMAGKPIEMSKVKQVIRMYESGVPKKQIAGRLGISKNTVKEYIKKIGSKNLSIPELLQKDTPELEGLFVSSIYKGRKYLQLASQFPYFEKELKRTGVTRYLLWHEYKAKNPDGYSYSRFSYHFAQWLKTSNASMHMNHEPGDKLYIDFAGRKLSYIDRQTGEIVPVEVLITSLGYSQKIYAQACRDQSKESFVNGCENALRYYEGAPKAVVPDNLKSAVTIASKYEPKINEMYREFANHYGMYVYPARSRAPQDKSLVEKAVSIVYNRIYAPIRDRNFFSIDELNQTISDLLDPLNEVNFQGKPFSRCDLFKKEEKHLLSPLRHDCFEIRHSVRVTIMKNSHVLLGKDKHYYSVPFRHIGKRVKLVYGDRTVSIYSGGERIAFHKRDPRPYKYTTNPDHLPSTHRFVADWSPEKFLSWAASIDKDVETYIQGIFDRNPYPEIAYRSCSGILSMAKKKGKDRLINACRRGLHYQSYGYQVILNILQKGLDKELFVEETQQRLPLHDNIRGADYYK